MGRAIKPYNASHGPVAQRRGDRYRGTFSCRAGKEGRAPMKSWTRREFGGLTGAAVLTALRPRRAHSQAKAKVVVIGGGVGGATVARYLASGTAPGFALSNR